ncbi:MAG: hypothetical protein LBB73_04605 [Dysgonamonadaceae bacterium]|nr:hypothetical protein [Dysgonamonadaceae bacterium]
MIIKNCRPDLDSGRVYTGGLKARKSLARGNALCHGRLLTLEALKGRNLFVLIPPFQGLVNVMHSVRRALPCATDSRAFSPPVVLITGHDTGR